MPWILTQNSGSNQNPALGAESVNDRMREEAADVLGRYGHHLRLQPARPNLD